MSWLIKGNQDFVGVDEKARQHNHGRYKPNHADRSLGRLGFAAMAGSEALFDNERPFRTEDEPLEPVDVP